MLRLALLVLVIALPVRADPPPAGAIPVPLGEYRIALPDGEGPFPVIVHLHGWGASADGVMANRGFLRGFLTRGYAVIAPQGIAQPGRSQRDWGVRDGTSHPRDDAAFFAEIIDHAAGRGWIDRDRILMTGFSRGGSMVWDIACHHPGLVAAHAPVAGAFWEPMPAECAAPVDLFHTHGWTDSVVPLEGRSVAGGRLTQGDTFSSLAILRATNGVPRANNDAYPVTRHVDPAENVWHRAWTAKSGARIDLMLHAGPHGIPRGWADRAIDWFEARLTARASQ